MNFQKKTPINGWRFGKTYRLTVKFLAGTDTATVDISRGDRIENVRSINLLEYNITLPPNAANTFPATLDIYSQPNLFLSNLQNTGPIDSIPICLQEGYQTPLNNTRFCALYPSNYTVSDVHYPTSKLFPTNLTFTLSSTSTPALGAPSNNPNFLPENRFTVAEESALIFEITTWEKALIDQTQSKLNIVRPYQL